MIRNLKALGLAFVAVFAMSAMAASAAQAAEAHFTNDGAGNKAVLTAEQDPTEPHQVFTTEFGAVDCSMVFAEATVENTGTAATFKNVSYFGTTTNTAGNCTFAGIAAVVNMNGCNYNFHAGTIVKAGESSGTVDLECPTTAGPVITIGGGACVIKVHGEQNGLGPVTYTTTKTGTKEEITANANITKIKYTAEGPSCPGKGVTEDGTYKGRATVKAYEDEGIGQPHGIQVNATITST